MRGTINRHRPEDIFQYANPPSAGSVIFDVKPAGRSGTDAVGHSLRGASWAGVSVIQAQTSISLPRYGKVRASSTK